MKIILATPTELKRYWDFIARLNLDWVCPCIDKSGPNTRNEKGHVLHKKCMKVPASKVFECAGCDDYATIADIAFSSPRISYHCDYCFEMFGAVA